MPNPIAHSQGQPTQTDANLKIDIPSSAGQHRAPEKYGRELESLLTEGYQSAATCLNRLLLWEALPMKTHLQESTRLVSAGTGRS